LPRANLSSLTLRLVRVTKGVDSGYWGGGKTAKGDNSPTPTNLPPWGGLASEKQRGENSKSKKTDGIWGGKSNQERISADIREKRKTIIAMGGGGLSLLRKDFARKEGSFRGLVIRYQTGSRQQ